MSWGERGETENVGICPGSVYQLPVVGRSLEGGQRDGVAGRLSDGGHETCLAGGPACYRHAFMVADFLFLCFRTPCAF